MFKKKIKRIMKIDGMNCTHCTMKVEAALGSIEEVVKVKVSLKNKSATIYLKKDIDPKILKKQVEELGYNVIDIK